MLFLIQSIHRGYSSSPSGSAHACAHVCLCVWVHVCFDSGGGGGGKTQGERGTGQRREKERNEMRDRNQRRLSNSWVCFFWLHVCCLTGVGERKWSVRELLNLNSTQDPWQPNTHAHIHTHLFMFSVLGRVSVFFVQSFFSHSWHSEEVKGPLFADLEQAIPSGRV